MEQFKKAKVVLLPTEKESCLFIGYNDKLYSEYSKDNKLVNNQQLLIISDEEIISTDYWFNLDRNDINSGELWDIANIAPSCKKIIASYPPLKIKCIECSDIGFCNKEKCNYPICKYLPQPTQQFIEQYIESYNKGEVITDVLVEYEKVKDTWATLDTCTLTYKENLKVNPLDNTITIKPVKDSWNREELIELMWRAYKQADTIFVEEEGLRKEFDRWITKIL